MPKQKNHFTLYLMHARKTSINVTAEDVEKAIYENRQKEQKIYSTPEEIRSTRLTEKLRNAGAEGDTSAAKRLANHEWYMRNKDWKKDYNAKYYQENKEYWQQYYKFAKDTLDARTRFADQARKEYDEAKQKYGMGSNEYKRAHDVAMSNDLWVRQNKVDLEAAKENLDRAMDEYNWAKTTFGKTPVQTLWNTGTKQIVDSGKSFISNWKSGLNTLASSIKSLFR